MLTSLDWLWCFSSQAPPPPAPAIALKYLPPMGLVLFWRCGLNPEVGWAPSSIPIPPLPWVPLRLPHSLSKTAHFLLQACFFLRSSVLVKGLPTILPPRVHLCGSSTITLLPLWSPSAPGQPPLPLLLPSSGLPPSGFLPNSPNPFSTQPPAPSLKVIFSA